MKRASRLLLAAGTTVVVAVAGAVLWSAPWLVGIGAATAEDLRTVSNRLAAKLPVAIDAETRLEGVEPGAGLEQVLRFRLVKQDLGEIAASGAAARLHERARDGICGQASAAPLVRRGVRVTYVYTDRAGREAIRFSVRPEECLWARVRHLAGA